MARTRSCLGLAAALVIVLAACGPEEAAPEVVPSGETSDVTPADDSGNGAGKPKGRAADDGETRPGVEAGGGSKGAEPGASDPIAPGPDKPAETEPALSLPRLPIGGDASDPDSAGVQCADVNWLGTPGGPADLTPGIRVAVTGVVFSPAVFTLADGGCEDAPPCSGYVYQVGADRCSVAVAPRSGAVDPGGPYFFTLTGKVDCTSLGNERCAAFAHAVAGEPDQSIPLSAPIGTDEADNSTAPDPGTDETDGAGPSDSENGSTGTPDSTVQGETGGDGDTPSSGGTGEETPQPVDPPAE